MVFGLSLLVLWCAVFHPLVSIPVCLYIVSMHRYLHNLLNLYLYHLFPVLIGNNKLFLLFLSCSVYNWNEFRLEIIDVPHMVYKCNFINATWHIIQILFCINISDKIKNVVFCAMCYMKLFHVLWILFNVIWMVQYSPSSYSGHKNQRRKQQTVVTKKNLWWLLKLTVIPSHHTSSHHPAIQTKYIL